MSEIEPKDPTQKIVEYRFPQGAIGENYRLTKGTVLQLAPGAALKDGDKTIGKVISGTIQEDGIHVIVQIDDKNVWDSIHDGGPFSIRGDL